MRRLGDPRVLVGSALLLALAAACGPASKPRPVGPTAPLAPVATEPGDPVALGTTLSVAPSGDQVHARDGGLTISVPAGALATTTPVSITPITNTARGGLGSAYRLGPDGTTFAVPVTLTFRAPTSYPAGTSMSIAGVGVEYQDAKGWWHRVEPVTRDPQAGTISVTTTHFSDWALTWQGGTAAAEGPINLVQTGGIPFTATGRATVFFLGDDPSDTSYGLTGTLTVQDPSVAVGDATCVPSPRTLTLPLNVAEVHKGTPPVFRWGIGVTWTLTCTGPGGVARPSVLMPSQFDTMGINLSRCPGDYAAGQIVTDTQLQGAYTKTCGADVPGYGGGLVHADWDLSSCVPDAACSLGVDCRLGVTVCPGGIASCVDGGPAPDGTACGPSGRYVCAATQCVNPAGVAVTPAGGLVTTVSGRTATFSAALAWPPNADVTFPLASTDPSAGTPAPGSLTFTSANWATPQVATVTGGTATGPYAISLGPASTSDFLYAGLSASVSATNASPGVRVTPRSAGVTTASGGTAAFGVALTWPPTADVTFPLTTSDPLAGTPAPASLTFTPLDWSAEQVVTVTGGPMTGPYTVSLGPASSVDLLYAGTSSSVALTNGNPGVLVTPASGLVTTVAGTTATFTVALTWQPTADVTFLVAPSNPLAGTATPASLTFSSASWATPQAVTVTGGSVTGPYTIALGPGSSADPLYSGMTASATATNESPGVRVAPASGLVTTASGGTASFRVALTWAPTGDVSFPLTSSDPQAGTPSPASLTFTSLDWAAEQVVTVTGAAVTGPYGVTVGPATTSDPLYAGTSATVALTNENPGVRVTPASGLVTTASGDVATFTVALTWAPTADVTLPLTSSDPQAGTPAPPSLTFTTADWAAEQVVTVTGAPTTGPYTITVGPAAGLDPLYSGRGASVAVSNTNPGVLVTQASGLVTTVSGKTATFGVSLTWPPAEDVTLPLTSSDPVAGTPSPASLTFTAANWATPQPITVSGGTVTGPYAISVGPASSVDPLYQGRGTAVAVTNASPGARTTPVNGLVTTASGGTATFSVALTWQPAADVTFALTSSDPLAGTPSPASLTFTSASWATPKSVTLTGGSATGPYTIALGPAVSSDPLYSGMSASVTATNASPGVLVAPASGLVTTVSGGTATFDVSLTWPPAADVTFAVAPSDPLAGTPSPAVLTFTSTSWSTPQPVTVTGGSATGPYTVSLGPASSLDPLYSGTIASVALTNENPSVLVTPSSGLFTEAPGGAATFTVALGWAPAADVTFPLSSSDPAAGTPSPASLAFTALDWSTPQLVTVTGGSVTGPYTIFLGPASSFDPLYVGTTAAVTLTSASPGVRVTPAGGLATVSGGTATFTVTLRAPPAGDVTLPLISSDPLAGTPAPTSLTFTSLDWGVEQVVTVTGGSNAGPYSITLGPAASLDPLYSGTTIQVDLTNTP